ncbi:MAG: YfhO family protein [Bacteroidia bacterium]|nr:YfhO family protein [Bacteroidia bacterium]
MKSFIKENKKILLIAFGLFIGITLFMFRPLLDNKELYQGDVERHRGMSKEIMDFREKYGKEPLWTNAMFSGMPAYQISTIHKGNLLSWFDLYLFKAFLPHPSGYVFLYFLGFFILMLCLEISLPVALWASLAYGLGSYFIIIIEAGHNSKANALGYLPAMIGGFILLFRGKYVPGFVLFSFFTALELHANHVQITYYGYMILVTIGVFYLVQSIKEKKIKSFLIATALAVLATVLGILPNAGNLWCTYEYGQWSTRGKSELTITPEGEKDKNKTAGLDKNYATQWSYGIDETFTFLIPDFKGGASKPISKTFSDAVKKVNPEFREQVGMMTAYFGPQPFTSGPVYLGVWVVLLSLLALFLTKNSLKYPLAAITLLAVMLSWGKHFPTLTNFFLDHVPGYNKFRAVSMILVIPQLTLPLLAVLGIQEMLREGFLKISIRFLGKNLPVQKFIIGFGVLVMMFLLSVAYVPGLWQNFSAPDEEKMLVSEFVQSGYPEEQVKTVVAQLMPELEKARAEIVKSDAKRSLLFAFLGFLFIYVWMKGKLTSMWLMGGLISITVIDLMTVDYRYLNKDSFQPKGQMIQRLGMQTEADRQILSDSALHKRVLNLSVSTFNDASTSYFHQSIGGYHGAKSKKYQEIIDFHLDREIRMIFSGINSVRDTDSAYAELFRPMQVLNMLNTKYVMLASRESREPVLVKNPSAFGPAWFVSEVKEVPNADSEIVALGKVDLKKIAVTQSKHAGIIKKKNFSNSSENRVTIKKYIANEAVYEVDAKEEGFIVFSEIYYPYGWNAYIDGKICPHVPVNYILRGLEVPAGKHTVEFKFEPKSYETSNRIALAGSLLLFAVVGGGVYWWFRKAGLSV